jgi:UDP-N-acetyl-D-galactosamine dehydrogenase
LCEFGGAALVADPLADQAEAKGECGVELVPLEHFTTLDGLILAVRHGILAGRAWDKLFAALAPGGVSVDVKSVVARD